MKVILKFDKYEEREELEYALNGSKYATVIEDTIEYIRGWLKYRDEELTPDQIFILENVRTKIGEIMDNVGIKEP